MDMPSHTYEEIRAIALDVLSTRPNGQFNDFLEAIGQELLKRHGAWPLHPRHTGVAYTGVADFLHRDDPALILEVFWDFFRQGAVTLGRDAHQGGWPWYRLTRFGRHLSQQTTFRFHDTEAYIRLVKIQVPDVSSEAIRYLEEAVVSFYADCLLASCVMLGVAAEAEFLRLIAVVLGNAKYAQAFSSVGAPPFIRQKITAFAAALKPLIPALPK